MGVIKLIKHDDAVNAIMSCNSRAMSGFDWIRRGEALQNLDDIQGEERKSGTWEIIQDSSWSGGAYVKCSECGNGLALGAYFEADEFEWCPKCGADMRGDTDEVD